MNNEDKAFLRRLNRHEIKWNYEDLENAKRLKIRGYTEYVVDTYLG